MTEHDQNPTGESLDQLLEHVVFEDKDPRVQRLRAVWEDAKREAQALFETACREQYEQRLAYHRTCGEPDPEELAERDVRLLRPVLAEEREQRLTAIWSDIYRRVGEILRENALGAADELPGTSSDGGSGDSPGT